MVKICLDAGHYGKYNRSPANKNYYESVAMWTLHLLQKKYLEAYGFEVVLTRDKMETDVGVYTRGTKSKDCDLFISNHSNATGSGVKESVDYPIVYVPLNGKGDIIGKRLTDCIAETMGTTQPGRTASRRGDNGDYYGVIRGATAVGTVGILLEHSFHTNTRSTNWLLDEENLDELARAEAKVIAEYFGVKVPVGSSTPNATETPWYRVRKTWEDKASQVGAYKVLDNAKEKADETGLNVYDASGKCVYSPKSEETFKVRVTIKDLNIRKGAGTNYDKVGHIEPGVYTITEVKSGRGSDIGWGKLKSGIGWISLDFVERL